MTERTRINGRTDGFMNFYVSPFLFLPHGQDRRLQVAGGLLLQSFSAYFGTCPINGTRGSTIEITWMNVEREREGMGVTLGTHNQDWNLKRGREGVITNSTKEIMLGTHWICHHNPALNGRGNLTLACRLHEELTLFFLGFFWITPYTTSSSSQDHGCGWPEETVSPLCDRPEVFMYIHANQNIHVRWNYTGSEVL